MSETLIHTISIDLETRSGADITKTGVYRYAEDEAFDILLFGVSVNHGPVEVYDLTDNETIPEEILQALNDPEIIKTAYNAGFERVCLSEWLRRHRPNLLQDKRYLNPQGWRCTLVWGAYNGLPIGLEKIGAALGLEQQKMKEGKSLIRWFCCPVHSSPLLPSSTLFDTDRRGQGSDRKAPLFPSSTFFDADRRGFGGRSESPPMFHSPLADGRRGQGSDRKAPLLPSSTFFDADRRGQGSDRKAPLFPSSLADDRRGQGSDRKAPLFPSSLADDRRGQGGDRKAPLFPSSLADGRRGLGGRSESPPIFHSPDDSPEKWNLFKAYNQRDVEVELQIQQHLQNHPVPDEIWQQYVQDQEINDRGIRIDRTLVTQALRIDERAKAELTEKLRALTGLENPNSVTQLKQYLNDHGIDTPTLGKKEAQALIKTVPPDIQTILNLRLQIAKSSVKKYAAMENAVCKDGRCRGMFQFYGANRSGRWAGRLIQLQNLPQNHIPDLEQARALTRNGDYEMLNMLYDSVPGVLSELIRTAFIPSPNHKFIVADFSAIEARCLSFLAGEQWRIDTFHEGRDIYCESASRMFHKTVIKNGENGHLRQRGKIAELALGYGGSTGALVAMGATAMGIPENELRPLVDAWREANPRIVNYWWAVDQAAKTAIRMRIPQHVGNVHFEMKSSVLFITLPSGRQLAYLHPRIEPNQFGGESITYDGTNPKGAWGAIGKPPRMESYFGPKPKGAWGAIGKPPRVESYGPKFVENIIQAICRDILADSMRRMSHYTIVAHVHDELIIEADQDTTVEQICQEMQKSPDWLPGIELRADGYECPGYYLKK